MFCETIIPGLVVRGPLPPTSPPATPLSPEDEGFVPRFLKGLLGYAQAKLSAEPSLTVRLTMSMVEVYNEEIRGRRLPGRRASRSALGKGPMPFSTRVCPPPQNNHPDSSRPREVAAVGQVLESAFRQPDFWGAAPPGSGESHDGLGLGGGPLILEKSSRVEVFFLAGR